MSQPDYGEQLDWLYQTQLFGIKLGLENTTRLLEGLGLIEAMEGKKVLHVAGTNGKGSVCAFAYQILRDGGFTVGLFTSPHLIRFPERIQVNGDPAGEDSLVDKIARIREMVAEWDPHPTFFEITLAVGLMEFCERDCEIIILETGMGGRLDATNAVQSTVCVITQIGLDHQQWLGETIREIAAEKAGILKSEVPVIVADVHPDARDVIGRKALELGIPYIEAHPLPDDWQPGLPGEHQRENAALAVEAACRLAGDDLTFEGIRQSLETVSWPGRFQRIGSRLVLDGAHNESAAEALARTWTDVFGKEKATLVFGAAKTKDLVGVFTHLGPLLERVFFVPIQSERRLSPEEMRTALDEAGFSEVPSEPAESLRDALELARSGSIRTLVTGSLYLIGEALSLLENAEFEVSNQ